MRKCIINYATKKPVDLHQKCADVITGCTGNANFPDLPTTVANMTIKNAALQTAMNNAAGKDRVMLAALRNAKVEVAEMLRGTALYVNTVVTDGDEEKLLSSGLSLTKVPEPQGPPEMVVNLKAVFTNNPGKISLRWDRAEFARFYHVYRSADAGVTWTLVSPIFTTKFLDNGLINDKRYHYKVVSVNELGEATPSDVATQLAA